MVTFTRHFGRERTMKTTPTVDDIFALAHQIGVPLPERLRICDDWSTVLHELAHWAVKPVGYVQVYLEKIKPYSGFLILNSIPDADIVMPLAQRPTVRWANGHQRQLQFNHVGVYQLDPTPDEFGARAWGLQVLERMSWLNPLDCEGLKDRYKDGVGSAQFDWAELTSKEDHIISRYGPEQLDFMGIDVASGILRPQVEVTFDAQWIRAWRGNDLVWQLDIFEGVTLVEWEAPSQSSQLITLEDIEALCGTL